MTKKVAKSLSSIQRNAAIAEFNKDEAPKVESNESTRDEYIKKMLLDYLTQHTEIEGAALLSLTKDIGNGTQTITTPANLSDIELLMMLRATWKGTKNAMKID
jgi:hypothetical protein